MLLLLLLLIANLSLGWATARSDIRDALIGWNFDKERVDTDLLIDVSDDFYNDLSAFRVDNSTPNSRYSRIYGDIIGHFSDENIIKLGHLIKLLKDDFPKKVIDRIDNDIEKTSQPENRAFRSYLRYFRADAWGLLGDYGEAWASMCQARKFRQGISGGISKHELAELNGLIAIQRMVDFIKEVSGHSIEIDSMESIETSLLDYARLLRTFGALTVEGSTEQSMLHDSALVKLNALDQEFKYSFEQRVLQNFLADLRKESLEEADELIGHLRNKNDLKSRILEAYVQYFKADIYRRYDDCDSLADSEAALRQVKNCRQVDGDVLRDEIVRLEGKIVFKWMVCFHRWIAKN